MAEFISDANNVRGQDEAYEGSIGLDCRAFDGVVGPSLSLDYYVRRPSNR